MSRIERLNSLIKQEIAAILRKFDDAKVRLVSIIDVEISKDLTLAKVYYSQIGSDEDKKKTYWRLKTSARFIKGEIGKVIHIRTIPNLVFIYDESLERGDRVLEKLKQLQKDENPD